VRIKIVATHEAAWLRIHVLVATLTRHGHTITNDPTTADIYILDCMRPDHIPNQVIEEVMAYRGQIILTSLGDWSSFNTQMEGRSLPEEIVDRAVAFAKIQWTKNDDDYDPRIIGKQVIMQPFLIGGLKPPAVSKKPTVSFYGLPTGDLETEKNLRILACRALKDRPWFRGGIVGQEPGAQRDISGVETGHRPRAFYLNSINNSMVSLCMPGNSVLTYRHFESLGMRSCVVTCLLDQFKWLNKLVPGEHYLEVAPDLSNLVEVCEKALQDTKGTAKIAENGYAMYQHYYRLLQDGSMTDAMWDDITSQLREMGVRL